MNRREDLKKGLQELVKKGSEIFELSPTKSGEILEFGTEYQIWYTKALSIVEILAKDRLEEFINYYRIDPKRKDVTVHNYVIQDFIMFRSSKDYFGEPQWDINNATAVKVYNQLQILRSLESRIDSVFSDVQGSLLAEIQDKELATAQELLKTNVRAAGSLAGVILENHLQKVTQNHRIPIRKKDPTISDMNDHLKNNNIYDIPIWRKIQYLADIRNLCSHKKDSEPTEEQVKELISGVNEVIRKIF